MAKGTIEFRVVTTDNGFIVEGGNKTMVAKNEAEIGEAVLAIIKESGKTEQKRPATKRKRRTKEEIAAAKAGTQG